jgi:hypothetical protein
MLDTFNIFCPNILENSLNKPILTKRPNIKRKYTFIKQSKAVSVLFAKCFLSLNYINKTKQIYKCSNYCLAKVTSEQILEVCKQYIPLSALKKNKWIRSYVSFNKVTFSTTEMIQWHINGNNICQNCWFAAATVTSYKLKHYSMKNM